MVRKILIMLWLVSVGAGFSLGTAWLIEPSNPECTLSTPHGQMLDWVLTDPVKQIHPETEIAPEHAGPCSPRFTDIGPDARDIGHDPLATIMFFVLLILMAGYIATHL